MSGGMTNRSAIPGPAPAQSLVPATGAAVTLAQVLDASNPRLAPSHPPADDSESSRSHPSLIALTRLLARQISRSEGGDG